MIIFWIVRLQHKIYVKYPCTRTFIATTIKTNLYKCCTLVWEHPYLELVQLKIVRPGHAQPWRAFLSQHTFSLFSWRQSLVFSEQLLLFLPKTITISKNDLLYTWNLNNNSSFLHFSHICTKGTVHRLHHMIFINLNQTQRFFSSCLHCKHHCNSFFFYI